MVSGRMKFWLTQDSRARLSAGWSVRTSGSKPMLQACATRPPKAGGEVIDPRVALADMGEGVSEAGARGDLQHGVRQIDLRHAGRDGRLQGDEAGRPFELVERAEHQLVAVVASFDPGGWVVGQVGGDLTPGAIQPGGQIADLRLGIERTVQGAADSQACGVPGLPTQQALPRVGVADAGRDEHVRGLSPDWKTSKAAKT